MAVHTVRRMQPATEVLRQGKILLVEECGDDRAHLAAMLSAEGHQVRECSSCTRAIDLLADESFDIVLVGQGDNPAAEREVVEWAKAANPQVPVVLLVNDPRLPEDYRSIQTELASYVPKPISRFEEIELKETVRRHMKPRVLVLGLGRQRS